MTTTNAESVDRYLILIEGGPPSNSKVWRSMGWPCQSPVAQAFT